MLSVIDNQLLFRLEDKNTVKTQRNFKKDIYHLDDLLCHINSTINNFNAAYENFQKEKNLVIKKENSFKNILTRFNIVKNEIIPETSGSILFRLHELEILIGDLISKIQILENLYNISFIDQKELLKIEDKKIKNIGLQLANGCLKSTNEIIIDHCVIPYLSDIDENMDFHNGKDKAQLMKDLQTGREVFSKKLIDFFCKKRLLPLEKQKAYLMALSGDAFVLFSLFKKNELKTFLYSRKIFEEIQYILSHKQDTDFDKLEITIANETNGLDEEEAKEKIEKICIEWFGLTDLLSDLLINIKCVSNNNNLVIQISCDNEYPFTFMRSKMLEQNERAVLQLQQSNARKYLATEWFCVNYNPKDDPEKYRYNLIPWFPNSNFESFAIKVVASKKLTLKEKQEKILLAINKMIYTILFLRDLNVIHPDIKPSNFLIGNNKDRNACLADWKTLLIHSFSQEKSIDWKKIVTTELYQSPEQNLKTDYTTKQCEDFDRHQSFMFGISFYQMMQGWNVDILNTNSSNMQSIFYHNSECLLSFEHEMFSGSLGKITKFLIKNMLKPDYKERPVLREVFDIINLSIFKADKIDEKVFDTVQSIDELTELFTSHNKAKSISSPLPEDFDDNNFLQKNNSSEFDDSVKAEKYSTNTLSWRSVSDNSSRYNSSFLIGDRRNNNNNNNENNQSNNIMSTSAMQEESWIKSNKTNLFTGKFLGLRRNTNNNNIQVQETDASELLQKNGSNWDDFNQSRCG